MKALLFALSFLFAAPSLGSGGYITKGIGPWQSYTGTVTGTSVNPTPGAGAVIHAWYRVNGKSLDIFYSYTQTGAGSAGSGVYLFPIPTGFTIDTSKLGSIATNNSAHVGSASIGYSAGNGIGAVNVYDTTHLFLQTSVTSFSALAAGQTGDFTDASPGYSFSATVPIL